VTLTAPGISELVLGRVAGGGPAEAIVDASGRWSYEQLRHAVGEVAQRLCAVDPDGDVVAVALPRSAAGIVAMLATWWAGRTYVALDPQQPPERIGEMIRVAGATVVIAETPAARETALGIVSIAWSELEAAIESPAPGTSEMPAGACDPAYIVFTSGSTGSPKGVAMGERAISGLIQWHLDHDRRPGRRTAAFAAAGFDVAIQEVTATIGEGGVLIVVDEDTRRDPGALARLIDTEGIQRLFLPTAMLQLIAEEWETESPPASLETVICAGEQLHLTPAVRRLFVALGEARLHNHYGPAETHVVTAHELAPDPESWPPVAPIGSPLPGVRLALLGVDAAASGIGELQIIGSRVAEGYLGPESTVDRRFGVTPTGEATYRTGDLVRSEQGCLVFLGRVDRQVKISGYRVEPAEIETVALCHAEVRQCAVEPVAGPAGPDLVGFVVLQPGSAAEDEIQRVLGEHLRRTLPAHAVPARWHVLGQMPMTVNGKLDRAALRALAAEPPQPPVEGTGRDLLGEVLAAYAAVLGGAGIDPDANLFDLGGTSLRAAQVRARLSARLGRPIGITMIYNHPSARSLAHALTVDGSRLGPRGAGAGRDGHSPVPAPVRTASAATARRRRARRRDARGTG
jgi:amino acid adenylation domain-containing protein